MHDLLSLPERTDPKLRPDAMAGPFGSIDEVLRHPGMTIAEKRALLASWASDSNAVPGVPTLRQIEDGSLVAVDDILRALRSLDAGETNGQSPGRRSASWRAPFERRRGWTWRNWTANLRRGADDDDDDPPPCPVRAAIPPRPGGGAAFAYPEVEAA